MKTGEKGVQLLQHYESLHDGDLSVIGLQPKRDPRGIWTVGWGHALFDSDGNGITDFTVAQRMFPQYMNIDIDTATRLLEQDLIPRENFVNSQGLVLNQDQFDACVDFVYNEGSGNFLGSTLLRYIRAGETVDNISTAFAMYNKGTIDGVRQVLPGLTFRRQSEATLFNTGELVFYN